MAIRNPVTLIAEALPRLPLIVRQGGIAVAVSVLLWLTLSPDDALPRVDLWDKAEHAIAFGVLTAICGLLFPRRRWAGAAGSVLLGIVIEILQAVMPFGRDGDWRDAVFDTIGVVLALVVPRLVARASKLPT
jgi:VanZ family protein